MGETIYSYEDLLEMLDSLLREPNHFWNEFYSNREKGIPFFKNIPDENLVDYFDQNLFKPGKVLELGCGPGRNAIFFAEKGCSVDAVDLSKESLKWAKERAIESNVNINFIESNIFDLEVDEEVYDIIYDSGCFHHIAPHRRLSYVNFVKSVLKPNGYFALNCFVPSGEFGGAEISDWEVYRIRSLQGGLGYSEEKLKTIFKDFRVVQIRKMKEVKQSNAVFGLNGLLTAVFQKI